MRERSKTHVEAASRPDGGQQSAVDPVHDRASTVPLHNRDAAVVNHQDHVNLLRDGIAAGEAQTWADLGSGGGAFTLALADLHQLFGSAFDTHCRVLTMGTYRGEWPVNRIAQGEDIDAEAALRGLYLVGDAVKPTGYLMVEGVAQSVNRFLDLLDGESHTARRHVVTPPSRLNALRWLWKAPGNAGRG